MKHEFSIQFAKTYISSPNISRIYHSLKAKVILSVVVFTFLNTTLLANNLTKCSNISLESNQNNQKDDMVDYLVNSADFRNFTRNYIIHMYEYGIVFKPVLANKDPFLNELKTCDQEETTVAGIYAKYRISYDEMLDKKNIIDNDVNSLGNLIPELATYGDAGSQEIILRAIDLGLVSSDAEWQSIRDLITADLQNINAPNALTATEIWGCIKGALGLTAAAGITLSTLVEASVPTIIKSVSATILKRFGWWGAALMIVDFSACIWDEYHD